MAKQFSHHLATLTLAITLELFTIPSLLTQYGRGNPAPTQTTPSPWEPGTASAYDPPPDMDAPGRRESGGRRPGDLTQLKCPSDTQVPSPPLTALVPIVKEENLNRQTATKLIGLTVEARPLFFVYVPQTSARTAVFILNDANEKEVYRTDVTLSYVSGIVSFKLPDNAPPLEIGKSYQWYFAIRCDSGNKKKDLVVDGWIWRTQLRPSIAEQIQKASPPDRAALYRQYQIWYEALATLADLRRDNPNNSQLATEWKELLESAGLSEFTEKL